MFLSTFPGMPGGDFPGMGGKGGGRGSKSVDTSMFYKPAEGDKNVSDGKIKKARRKLQEAGREVLPRQGRRP